MGRFWKKVELAQEGYVTNGATPSSSGTIKNTRVINQALFPDSNWFSKLLRRISLKDVWKILRCTNLFCVCQTNSDNIYQYFYVQSEQTVDTL